MSKTVKTTRLGRIQNALAEAYLEALKGEVLTDGEGAPILIQGQPLLGPPKAAVLKEAREYLKDMGITEEPEDAESVPVAAIASRVRRFEDDQDLLLIEAAKEAEQQKGT